MMKKGVLTRICGYFLTFFIVLQPDSVNAQRFLSDVDSAFFYRDTVRSVVRRFENLRLTGYMQPQFQVAQSDGAPSYSGGNFSALSRSRFMLRRARVKVDYLLPSKNRYPAALFTFQFDATERGVVARDMFVKLFETSKNLFHITAGLFARPFGYEVNLSSSHRETPERGRMSQILMPSERDIGLMLSFEPQTRIELSHIKLDIGFFNGQGLSGTTDFDSHKDLITRLYIKPYTLNKLGISGGLSHLRGGWKNGTKYVYEIKPGNGDKLFEVDSSVSNLGTSSPRHYYGGDLQVKLEHDWGATEWRAEYWFGTQPGTALSTTNPGTLPTSNGLPTPTYIRHFDGAFFLFLQNLFNTKHQLMVKYDWYDPNIYVRELEIGKTGTNLTSADVTFSTLGAGYSYLINPQTRLIFYYDFVKNEITQLPGYTTDLKDNVFTCRLQFRF